MEQVTRNLGLQLGGITDEPALIPNMVSNMIKIDEAIGQGSADPVARAAAAAAQETADQASEDATGAMELAQQAMESGLKFKQLSYNEVVGILKLAGGTDGFNTVTGNSEMFKSYVINITPRIKFVSIGLNKVVNLSQGFALNTQYTLTYKGYPTIESASWSILTTLDCIPVLSSLETKYAVTFQGSATPSSNDKIDVRLNGIIEYNYDIDLGTDIA